MVSGQDQEPRIVRDQPQPVGAVAAMPADPPVAGGAFQRRRREADQRDPLPAVRGDIVQFMADAPKRTAPVMTLHQIIEPRLLATADQSQMQRRRVGLYCPDTPEHGHRVSETPAKVQQRTLVLDSYCIIGENTLALPLCLARK